MEHNREDAIKALKVAQAALASDDPTKALRFARKACALYWSPEAAALVRQLENGEGSSSAGGAAPAAGMNGSASGMNGSANATTSGAQPKAGTSAGAGLRSRTAATASSSSSSPAADDKKREWTPKQAEVVKRVRKCKVTEYYEILELKRDCEEVHVKSAYRKLALALHPDKNGAPGADEAFKMVSKAFQVLSDGDKRAAYDRHGADPDSRSAGMPSFSRGGGGMAPGFRGAGFDDVGIDPEELFRAFFGGGPGMAFGGGPFGGGNVYSFNLGGGGGPRFRGPGGQARRAGGEGAGQQTSIWVQLLPLLLLLALSGLSSLPSLFGGGGVQDPSFSWAKSQVYPVERTTLGSLGVTYHVNPTQFASHPIYHDFITANPSLGFKPPSGSSEPTSKTYVDALTKFLVGSEAGSVKAIAANPARKAAVKVPKGLRRFEQGVENAWVRKVQAECSAELAGKEDRKRRAMGFLGLVPNWEEIGKIEKEPTPSCDRLRKLGLSTQFYG